MCKEMYQNLKVLNVIAKGSRLLLSNSILPTILQTSNPGQATGTAIPPICGQNNGQHSKSLTDLFKTLV